MNSKTTFNMYKNHTLFKKALILLFTLD